MKKLLGILVLGLLWCNISFAEKIAVKKAIKLPKDIVQGYKNKWNFSCTWTENGKCMAPDYAYQIVNETDGHPVRFGKQSIRIELRKGDCHQRRKGSYNDCKASPPAERHEFGMEHGDVSPIRGTTWHTYSLYLPKDTPQIHSEWITMGQFHNIDYDKPPINLDLSGKHFYLVTRLLCIHPKKLNKTCYSNELGNTRKKILDSEKLFGQWNDFIFNAKWSSKNGFFKMWVNGKLLYHFVGRTVVPGDGTMFKFGIYRGKAISGDAEATHIVYYDEMRYAKKSCKKLNLEDLGYSCSDLESQTVSKIDKIK